MHKELRLNIKVYQEGGLYTTPTVHVETTSQLFIYVGKRGSNKENLVAIEEKDETQVGNHCWTAGHTADCIHRCSSCKLDSSRCSV